MSRRVTTAVPRTRCAPCPHLGRGWGGGGYRIIDRPDPHHPTALPSGEREQTEPSLDGVDLDVDGKLLSGLVLIADIAAWRRHCRVVPQADIILVEPCSLDVSIDAACDLRSFKMISQHPWQLRSRHSTKTAVCP